MRCPSNLLWTNRSISAYHGKDSWAEIAQKFNEHDGDDDELRINVRVQEQTGTSLDQQTINDKETLKLKKRPAK